MGISFYAKCSYFITSTEIALARSHFDISCMRSRVYVFGIITRAAPP